MDYSPWSKGKFWPFWRQSKMSHNSKTGETMTTKIGVQACDINPYMHEFFEPIPINQVFWWQWTIVHGPKGNLAVFESSNISETEEAMPTKIGVHALHIHSYLHKFFETILCNSIFWWPWTIVHGPKGNFGRFEGNQKWAITLKLETPCPPKLVYMHVTSIPTCVNFLRQFYAIQFFDDHGL